MVKSGVVGLDMSLRSPAACYIPMGWAADKRADTSKLTTWTYDGELPKEANDIDRLERIHQIASGLTRWCSRLPIAGIYIESYAFSMKSKASTALHELGGVIRIDLYRCLDTVVQEVTASACRKTLLQRLPKADSKKFTERNVRRLGGAALEWNGDEVDAFVVANHGLMLQGWTPLSFMGI